MFFKTPLITLFYLIKLIRLKSISVILMLVLNFQAKVSAEVYKWTDKNGKVHYSDKPFSAEDKALKLEQKPNTKQRVDAQKKAKQLLKQNQRLRSNLAEDKNDKIKAHNEQIKVNRLCDALRKELKTLNMQLRVYHVNDKGEREFLSEQQRQQQKAEIEKVLQQKCK
jgi:hypothetical protein